MSLYDLSNDKLPSIKLPKCELERFKKILGLFVFTALVASVFGFVAGAMTSIYFVPSASEYLVNLNLAGRSSRQTANEEKTTPKEYLSQSSEEDAIVKAVKEASPAVVSIIISKNVPIIEQYYINPFGDLFGNPFDIQVPQYRQKGVEKKQIGGGTGFIVSEDGMILTNKHVVLDAEAEYTVLTNDGKQLSAKVLARDPFQDLAVIKIDREQAFNAEGLFVTKPFSVVKFGDSDELKIGQTVIAIGNALGEFRNTVSVGVISGLGRTITASGGGMSETIEDVVQTDAAINSGNSGGLLLNLKGEVVGVNVAKADNAQSIGFAIPINYAKKDVEQVKTLGKITPPFLGIYYTMLTEKLKEENKLSVDYGAWIGRNDYGKPTDEAVAPGSAAQKAGLQKDDIILEFGGEEVTTDNTLSKIIRKYNPGDKVVLKILRGNEYKNIEVVLGARSE